LGLDPVVLTSPKHEDFNQSIETIDGTDYHRIRWPAFSGNLPVIKQAVSVTSTSKEIFRLASSLKVDVIHAHSPSLNGLAAGRAARMLGLPWVYEVRYFEEDAAVGRGKMADGSPRYRFLQHIEILALRRASRVAAISAALRNDLISRGIDGRKIDQVPNGVDTGFFSPQGPDAELAASLGLTGKIVIGFIGSFYFYEGLEYLVDAVLLLLDQGMDVKLLLAGEGEAEAALRQRIPEEYWDHFIFAGKVPHLDVRRYYSVMDLVVYPRISSRLTELTTPLKPLEAMAMERMVVGSDTGGIRELLAGGKVGALVAAQNPRVLAGCLARLAGSEAERRATGKAAREFVVRERDWEKIVSRYLQIYEEALRCSG
jgi:PEP-CTERM/exosortase A-associated glycosyltransferase